MNSSLPLVFPKLGFQVKSVFLHYFIIPSHISYYNLSADKFPAFTPTQMLYSSEMTMTAETVVAICQCGGKFVTKDDGTMLYTGGELMH